MQRNWTHWIAATVLIGSAHAQGAGPFPFTYQDATYWPSGISSPGTITRQIAADFIGDGSKHVFLLAGGKPVFCYKPDSWEAVYPVVNSGDPTYTDMALIPASESELPQAALVGPNGLDRLFYFPTTPIPSGGTIVAGSFVRMNLTDDSSWHDAKLVRAGWLDSGGTELDYVALGSDDHTVLVRLATSSGVTLSSFTLLETIYDIAILQWNDTEEREIALLDSYGVEIYQYSGPRIKRIARPTSGTEAFCVFRKNVVVGGDQVPDGHDRIAWIRQRVAGGQELVELTIPNQKVLSNVVITDPNDPIVSMTGVDLKTDGGGLDGNWELVAHHKLNCVPYIFKNVGPSVEDYHAEDPSFSNSGDPNESGSTWEMIDGSSLESVAGSYTMPAPICEDLSADGKTDLFIAASNGSSTYFDLWHGGQEAVKILDLWAPDGPGAYIVSARGVTGTAIPIGIATTSAWKVGLDLSIAQVPEGADILEITVWTRSPTGEYSNPYHIYYDLPDSPLPDFIYPVVPTEFGDVGCYSEQSWYELQFGHISGGSLVGLSRTYVDAVGGSSVALASLQEYDYSTAVCVEGGGGCSPGETNSLCIWDGGTTTITGPLSMTRRRIVAPSTSGGGSSIMPAPPTPTPVGAVATTN